MLHRGRAHAKTAFLSRRGNPGQQEIRRVDDSKRVSMSASQQHLSLQRASPGPRRPQPSPPVSKWPTLPLAPSPARHLPTARAPRSPSPAGDSEKRCRSGQRGPVVLCRSAWRAFVSRLGARRGGSVVTASVSGTLLEQEHSATHCSGRAITSPSGLRGSKNREV